MRTSAWPRGMIVVVLVAVTLITLLAVMISREGPDRTMIGRVESVESHRVCLTTSVSGPQQCVHVDQPQRVADVSPGDCLRVRYSAQDLLVSLQPDRTCR